MCPLEEGGRTGEREAARERGVRQLREKEKGEKIRTLTLECSLYTRSMISFGLIVGSLFFRSELYNVYASENRF